MAWSGGNFTRANPTWATDASLGIGIEAGRHDAQDNDFTTGIDQCLNKTGQNSMTGDLNLGGYRPTNVAAGTAAAPALCVANDVNTGIFQAAAAPDTLSIATGGTERMRIDSNGATGISTQGDTASETVSGLGRPQLQVKGTGTIGQIAVFSRPGNGDPAFLTFCKSRGSTTGSYTAVQPGDGLGQIGFLGATGTDFRQGAVIAGVQDGGTISATSMPGRLVFSTTINGDIVPAERMRIASDGTVGIGGLNDSTERLRVVGSDTTSSNYSFCARSSTTLVFCVRNDGRVGIGTGAPGYQLALSTDSAAKPTTNTWTIASDERIKTNVQPYAKGLAEICQVNPITYDYNGKGGIPAGPGGVSILAQELQPVFPECIGSYKGKLDESDEQDSEILNYNGHAMTFALINAVKELNAKVEALEAKVENLEAVTAGL